MTGFVRGAGVNGQVAEAPPPVRSVERQRLARAITAHRELSEAHSRVGLAIDRLRSERFERHRPALALARQELESAQASRPHRLVDQLLDDDLVGEESDADPVVEAQIAVSEAERKVEECRQSIALLEVELASRERALHLASSELDHAVAAVISNDPVKQAAVDEFFRCGRHLLKLASILRTLGNRVEGVSADDLGLVLRVSDQVRTGAGFTGTSAFKPEPAWLTALAALREDADWQFPDLPDADDNNDASPASNGAQSA